MVKETGGSLTSGGRKKGGREQSGCNLGRMLEVKGRKRPT